MNNEGNSNSELDAAFDNPEKTSSAGAFQDTDNPEALDTRQGATSSDMPFAGTHNFLLGVRLTVSVEVGRVQLPVREVLELGPGSLIELQRSTAEPVEMYANGRCIGKGEIVVIGDQFGVRVTELGAAA